MPIECEQLRAAHPAIVMCFPGASFTCPASRRAQMIGELMAKTGDDPYEVDDPHHIGQSILSTVASLWEARARIAQLEADAARYRYIKSLERVWFPKGYNGYRIGWFQIEIDAAVDDLDAAIDAARGEK